MTDEEALDAARASKAAWDAGDTDGAATLASSIRAWAAEKGGVIDQSSEGILSIVVSGAAEQLL